MILARIVLSIAALAALPPRAHAAPPDGAALLARFAPAIVNLRLTLRTEMEGGGHPGQDSSEEVAGVLVDPGGLVLVWNSHLSAGRMSELFADLSQDDGFRLKVTPVDVRIWIAGQEKEHRAFLAAADSDLDLAFVQLEEPPAAPLPFVDFAASAEPAVGDELVTVSRLSSRFDRAPFFDVVRVTGRLEKPRAAWIVGGGNATQAGLPYFDALGRPVGVLVTFVSRTSDAPSGASNRLFAELVSLGRGESEVGPLGLFLLPASRIDGRIELAREQARRLMEERRAEAAAAP